MSCLANLNHDRWFSLWHLVAQMGTVVLDMKSLKLCFRRMPKSIWPVAHPTRQRQHCKIKRRDWQRRRPSEDGRLASIRQATDERRCMSIDLLGCLFH